MWFLYSENPSKSNRELTNPYSALNKASHIKAIAAEDTTCGIKRIVLKTFHPLDLWAKSRAIINPNGTVINAAVMHQYKLFVIDLIKVFLLNSFA